MRFEELEQDPVGQMRAIYAALDLPEFVVVEPALRRFAASLGGYRKNAHRPLPAPLRRRLAREWRLLFESWGYPTAERRG